MHVIHARNVNDAYFKGMTYLQECGEHEASRAGPVLVVPYPVVTVYKEPWQRVLFDPVRDANPFFHLMEALWMLAGRNDATWLDQFVSNFSSRFSEDGTQHGAYGFRWRTHFVDDRLPGDDIVIDQLQAVIDKLRANQHDRRVVLQMWDTSTDLLADKKDIPCNLCIMLRIVYSALEITVPCRSNDIIWGAYGANAVHFSILQEYLARKIGVEVGPYYQISNNFHAYVDVYEAKMQGLKPHSDLYMAEVVKPTPLIEREQVGGNLKFDEDLRKFFGKVDPRLVDFETPFFNKIAVPMLLSFRCWRGGDREAAIHLLNKEHPAIPGKPQPDWILAAKQWYGRRIEKRPGAV